MEKSHSKFESDSKGVGSKQSCGEDPCPICGSTSKLKSDMFELCSRCSGQGMSKEDKVNHFAMLAAKFIPTPTPVALSDEEIERQVNAEKDSIPALYGDHTPAVELQREGTTHRAICYLAAQGLSNVEIAENLGVTATKVAYTKKQPWAAKFINELMDKHGRKAVIGVLHGAAAKAAQTMIDLMEGKHGAKPEVRGKMAMEILNRTLGTNPTTVLHGDVDPNSLSDEQLAQKVNDK